MADVATLGSSSTGHAGFHPTTAVSGNGKFKVFGKPIHCMGDAWAPHVRPFSPPHSGTAIGTSKMNVFGKPVAKLGDPTTCGDIIASGEPRFQVT